MSLAPAKHLHPSGMEVGGQNIQHEESLHELRQNFLARR